MKIGDTALVLKLFWTFCFALGTGDNRRSKKNEAGDQSSSSQKKNKNIKRYLKKYGKKRNLHARRSSQITHAWKMISTCRTRLAKGFMSLRNVSKEERGTYDFRATEATKVGWHGPLFTQAWHSLQLCLRCAMRDRGVNLETKFRPSNGLKKWFPLRCSQHIFFSEQDKIGYI